MSKSSPKANRVHSIFKRGGSLKGRVVVAAAATAVVIAIVVSAIDLSGGATAAKATTGTLFFGNGTTKLIGQTVLVPVRCVGAKDAVCSGELTLKGNGRPSDEPFSVTSGGDRVISASVHGAESGASVVATAKTQESSGAYATATEVLHLR